MISSPITSWQLEGEKVEAVTDFTFFSSKIPAEGDHKHEIKRRLLLGRKSATSLDNVLKSRHHLASKGPFIFESYGFSSSHVWRWELVHKEGWAPKNCFQIVVLEKTIASPLDSKEIKPVLKQINPEYGRIVAEAPILWPSDTKGRRTGRDPDTRKDWGKRWRGWQRIRWLDSITGKNLSKLQETVEDRGAWHVTVHEIAKSGTQLKRLNNSNNYMLSIKISLQIQNHREVKDKKKEINVMWPLVKKKADINHQRQKQREGLSQWQVGKNPPANARDTSPIPGPGRFYMPGCN